MKEKKSKKSTVAAQMSAEKPSIAIEQSCCCPKKAGAFKTACLCASILGAGLLVSAAIFLKAPTAATPLPAPRIVKPVVNDSVIQKYIESHPQVITSIVEKYLKEHAPKPAAPAAQPAPQPQADIPAIVAEIVKDPSNYSLGNPNGKYVIIEFFDYQCGWCKRTNASLHDAIAKPEGKNIRWIAIDTPIFGAKSEEISRYVLAAGKQGKYAEMHEAVGNEKTLNKEVLIGLGEKLGLDTKKLEADAEGAEIKAKMEANKKYSRALNINGVPFLIINGRPNPGALLGDKLEATIKESQNVQ